MNYKELGKNPVQYLLGVCIVVIGYLYNDMREDMADQKLYFLHGDCGVKRRKQRTKRGLC